MAEVIEIPAGYLEDVRTALVKQIHNDSCAIRTDHADVLDGQSSGVEDRAAAVRLLREDVRLLDQVLDATDSTMLTGEVGALAHLFGAVTRVLSARLVDRCQYSPIDAGVVLDLSERLGWAARESAKLEQGA